MQRDISKLEKNTYDLLVIGGGINGAAIANIAARRGLKVALLEKGDFASGTSGKSTKLIHGGLRYLENLEFGLVKESLKERYIQLRVAPYLVKPLAFIIPVYKNDQRPLWFMRLGVWLYEAFAGSYRIRSHKHLTKDQILQAEPNIRHKDLIGGVKYYDAQMDDARLCLENVLMANHYGADVANYVKVEAFIKNGKKTIGVKARDQITDRSFKLFAKKTVCAVGPWTDIVHKLDNKHAEKRIRTTKGVHIFYRGRLSSHALLIVSKSDNRVIFIIPWMNNTLIGTTDTNYSGHPDRVRPSKKDIDYLMNEARFVLPKHEFSQKRIMSTFAGLRPLIPMRGSPAKVSRRHEFFESPSGVLYVIGGKYTTYRRIAKECVNKIERQKVKEVFRLYGSGEIRERAGDVARRYKLNSNIISALMNKYGTRYKDVLKLIGNDPSLKEVISQDPPVVKAQLVYSVKTEMAQKLEDIIMRRLSLGYFGKISDKCRKAIKRVMPIGGKSGSRI